MEPIRVKVIKKVNKAIVPYSFFKGKDKEDILYLDPIESAWEKYEVEKRDRFNCLVMDYRQLFKGSKEVALKDGILETQDREYIGFSKDKEATKEDTGECFYTNIDEGFFPNEFFNKKLGMIKTQIVIIPNDLSEAEKAAFKARCNGINLHVMTETEFEKFKDLNKKLKIKEVPARDGKNKSIGDISAFFEKKYYNKYSEIKGIWEKYFVEQEINSKDNSKNNNKRKAVVFDFDKTLCNGKNYNANGKLVKFVHVQLIESLKKFQEDNLDVDIVLLTGSDQNTVKNFANSINEEYESKGKFYFYNVKKDGLKGIEPKKGLNVFCDSSASKIEAFKKILKYRDVISYSGDGLNDIACQSLTLLNGGKVFLPKDSHPIVLKYFKDNKSPNLHVLNTNGGDNIMVEINEELESQLGKRNLHTEREKQRTEESCLSNVLQ
jgi:hypothetical protein